MANPAELRYTPSHEWLRQESDGSLTVGITAHAQEELGDLVYVELPEVGRALKAGEACCVVESTKAASDVYAPVSGTITAANDSLPAAPERVNEAPFGDGWLFRIQPDDPKAFDALMSAADYDSAIGA